MQLGLQDLGPAEKHARLAGAVDLADAAEDGVPVWATEKGRTAQTRDGVAGGVSVVDHDVGRVVGFDVGGEVLCVADVSVDAEGTDRGME